MDNHKEMLYEEETEKIIGAAIAVQRELGTGFLEPVYQEALAIEFKLRGIPYEREKELSINYKGFILDKTYRADFVCYDKILLELKAVDRLTSEHTAQVLNYLNATEFKLGLLVNFGECPIKPKRIIL